MRSKALRLAVPASLALHGAGLLSGCIFIPTFGVTIQGKNVAGDVGDAQSRKPVRVDHATIQDVYHVLGPPLYTSEDGRRVGYQWRVLNAYWVGLCFGPQEGERLLILDFDGEGVLRSFRVAAADGGIPLYAAAPPGTLAWREGFRPFPTGPVLVPLTQPVTIPSGPLPPDPIPNRPAATAPAAPLPPDAVPYRTPGK